MFPVSNELCRERTARLWQMSNLWVFCGFSPRNDGFVKVGDVLFDEVYVLFYFFRFFVLIKGNFFLSLTTHDMTIDTPLIRKLYMAPLVSVLPGLYCIYTTWLLSHSSLGRRIGWWGGRKWRCENIVWPNFAFLVVKTVPYVLGAIPTSFPGFSPTRPFKSYQYCRNCKMKANRWELRDTRGDKIRMNKRQNPQAW